MLRIEFGERFLIRMKPIFQMLAAHSQLILNHLVPLHVRFRLVGFNRAHGSSQVLISLEHARKRPRFNRLFQFQHSLRVELDEWAQICQ